MSKLKISDDLALPLNAVTEALAFMGRRGSGKSYAATKLAELFHEHGAQFVAVDPVGILQVGGGCGRMSKPDQWWNTDPALTTNPPSKEVGVMASPNVNAHAHAVKSKRCLDLTKPLDQETKDRLRARIEKYTQKTEGCWLWIGYLRNTMGHGGISVHDHPEWVHRLVYAISRGVIPDGACVCHRCDVPNCVNPDHLFLGTQPDNLADMRRKRRGSKPPQHFGESNSNATLSDKQIDSLRAEYASGRMTQRQIAKKYGVSQSSVWRITKHITRNVGQQA